MRLLFVFLLMVIALFATAQSGEMDSCSIAPLHSAMFEGLTKKGMLSAEDLKYVQAMRSRDILSVECIVAKNKKGELVACKPFLFYIR